MALFAQLRAGRFGAAVLPDDGVVNGLAGFAVPDHRGFALVGNAQRADVLRFQAGLGQRLAGRGQLAAPDFHRIVFDPARSGINLRQLLLGQRHDAAVFVKHNAARAGGALVEGKKVSHGVSRGRDAREVERKYFTVNEYCHQSGRCPPKLDNHPKMDIYDYGR